MRFIFSFFCSLLVVFTSNSLFAREFVRLKVPKEIDLVVTPKIDFGFEYANNPRNTRQRGNLFDYPMTYATFKKFDLHIFGEPYNGGHRSLHFSPEQVHKHNGSIYVSYKHPKNRALVVHDTIKIPYPENIEFNVDELSFGNYRSLSAKVFYDNGKIREYSHNRMIQFFESYGIKLEIDKAKLIRGDFRSQRLFGKSKGEREIESLSYGKYFNGSKRLTEVNEDIAFDVLLEGDNFSDELLNSKAEIKLISGGINISQQINLVPNGSYRLYVRGKDGRNNSAWDGESGDHGPVMDVYVEEYNDSLFKYKVLYNNNEKIYVIDPRYGKLEVHSDGGHGGQGANGRSGCSASGSTRYGQVGESGDDGGNGGDGGDINIYHPSSFINYKYSLRAYSRGGNAGKAGRGGSGGRDRATQGSRNYTYARRGSNGRPGARGRNGRITFHVIN